MTPIRNILLVQDSENENGRSIEIAAHLQRKTNARVSVVDVVSQVDRSHDAIESRRDMLNGIVDASSLDAACTRVSILCGRPISVLIDEIIDACHDLVLKDVHSNSEGLFLGALDLRLLQLSPATVWLADPNSPARPESLMVAVSPNSTDSAINGELLAFATTLQEIDSAELYVVCSGDLDAVNEDEVILGHLERLFQQKGVRLPADRIIIGQGLASETILQACLDVQPDVLVMGTVAQRDVPGLWLGGTADAVVRQIQSSIIGVKPTDFSPILPSSLARQR